MKKESFRNLVVRLHKQRMRKVRLDADIRETQRMVLSRMMEKEEIRIQWERNKDCLVKKKVSQMREFSPRVLLELLGDQAFSILHASAAGVDAILPSLQQDKRDELMSSLTYRNTTPHVSLFFVSHKSSSEEVEEPSPANSVEPVLAKQRDALHAAGRESMEVT